MGPFYAFLSIIAIIWITKFTFLQKNTKLPPSPFPSLPVLGHLHLLKSPLHRALAKLSARYGPMLMLQFGNRRALVISSPSVMEECLTGTNDIAFCNRPHLLAGKHLGYNYTNLFWSSYGDHWRNLRRIASLEILSAHRLQTLNSIRAEEVRLMVKKVYVTAVSDGTVEMKSVFFELMLNVMMMMIAGKRYFGDSVEDVEEARRFKGIVKESFVVMEMTNLSDYVPWWKWVGGRGLEKKMVAVKEKRDGFMQGLLEDQRTKMDVAESGGSEEAIMKKEEEKKNLIEVLLNLQKTEPEYYNDEVIKGLMQVLLSAGTDSSSGTMEWALSLLLNNPETLKKAQAEIDNYIGGDHRLLNESDMANLPYLHCIINETLRMYPPGPLVFHESSKDCTVGGYHIPSGTMLSMNLWALQNDPKTWEDPKKFKPERFERLEGPRDGYKLMPFGAGRRKCPAESLAMRMIGSALGVLIQCFEWERVSEEMLDMTEGKGLTMPRVVPLVAKCKPRGKMANLLVQM